MMQEYPSWLYDGDKPIVVVMDEEEHRKSYPHLKNWSQYHGLQKQGQTPPEEVESVPDFLNPDAPKRRGRPRKE